MLPSVVHRCYGNDPVVQLPGRLSPGQSRLRHLHTNESGLFTKLQSRNKVLSLTTLTGFLWHLLHDVHNNVLRRFIRIRFDGGGQSLPDGFLDDSVRHRSAGPGTDFLRTRSTGPSRLHHRTRMRRQNLRWNLRGRHWNRNPCTCLQ